MGVEEEEEEGREESRGRCMQDLLECGPSVASPSWGCQMEGISAPFRVESRVQRTGSSSSNSRNVDYRTPRAKLRGPIFLSASFSTLEYRALHSILIKFGGSRFSWKQSGQEVKTRLTFDSP